MNEETELYAKEWMKMVHDNEIMFATWEEASESLISYLKGEEHPSHLYADKA